MNNLSTQFNSNIFSDPFIIASSHWTSSEKSFVQLSQIDPCALTLKTTSNKWGGDGKESAMRKREWGEIVNSNGERYGRYVDGPKKIELWDLATTFVNTDLVKKILPGSQIGLSILQGEQYDDIKKSLNLDDFAYVELNLKYSLRNIENKDLILHIEKLFSDIKAFHSVFSPLPIFIKLPREFLDTYYLIYLQEIYKFLKDNGITLIIANSKRLKVPPSKIDSFSKHPNFYHNGVVIGDYLFMETFDALMRIKEIKSIDFEIPRIIASGGIMDIRTFIDIIAAGAEAVQLCTILDVNGVQVVNVLRQQLAEIINTFGSFEEFKKSIQTNSANWLSAATYASELVDKAENRIHEILKSKSRIVQILKDSIEYEIKDMDRTAVDDDNLEDEFYLNDDFKFIISRSNVSSYLLAEQCVNDFHFIPIDITFSKDLKIALNKPEFNYDFAILSRSVLNFLQAESRTVMADHYPIEIGIIGRSRLELVGDKRKKLQDLNSIYFFPGESSRVAIAGLLKLHRNVEFYELNPSKLLPLLQYWKDSYAILVKHPLSQLYSIFCSDEISENWGAIWHTEQDLVLIASEKLLKKSDGEKIAKTVLSQIRSYADEKSSDPNLAARDLISRGFLAHLGKLCGLKDFKIDIVS